MRGRSWWWIDEQGRPPFREFPAVTHIDSTREESDRHRMRATRRREGPLRLAAFEVILGGVRGMRAICARCGSHALRRLGVRVGVSVMVVVPLGLLALSVPMPRRVTVLRQREMERNEERLQQQAQRDHEPQGSRSRGVRTAARHGGVRPKSRGDAIARATRVDDVPQVRTWTI